MRVFSMASGVQLGTTFAGNISEPLSFPLSQKSSTFLSAPFFLVGSASYSLYHQGPADIGAPSSLKGINVCSGPVWLA